MNLILMFFMQQGDGMTGLVSSLLPFLLIILVFYFLILRPQQKRQKEKQKLLDSIKKGDKVVTSGGMHGVVEGIEDKTVLIKIAENTKVKIDRSAIAAIIGLTPEVK